MEDKKVIPSMQEAKVRINNFDEVEHVYTDEEALTEAKRCLNCKVPQCVKGCPVAIQIPEFIKHIVEGNIEEAYKVITDSSSLPAVCGRVCPQETQCEAKCIKGLKGDAIAIGALERYVADQAIINKFNKISSVEKMVKKLP